MTDKNKYSRKIILLLKANKAMIPQSMFKMANAKYNTLERVKAEIDGQTEENGSPIRRNH